MREREHYRGEVATAARDASAAELADTMEFYAIGCVVIVDGDARPQGVVTDRDLVCRVIAKGRDPATVRAEEIMTHPLVAADAKEPLETLVERMCRSGVRRLPIVREDRLVGLVSVDDLLFELGAELGDLGETARDAVRASRKRGKRERRRDEWEEKLSDLRSSMERAGREAAEFVTREFEGLRDRLGGRGGRT